jgi:hypothetical protein
MHVEGTKAYALAHLTPWHASVRMRAKRLNLPSPVATQFYRSHVKTYTGIYIHNQSILGIKSSLLLSWL